VLVTDAMTTPERVLLAIETTASPWGFAVCGPAGLIGEHLVAQRPVETLVDHLKAVLPLWRIQPQQIGAIAVVTGPGQYMGVRGGVTTAKTLAQVWQVPVLAMEAATVLALQAPVGVRVAPVLDVRRNEVYAGIADRIEAGIIWQQAPAVHPWADWLVARTGDGPLLVHGTLSAAMRRDLTAQPSLQVWPAGWPVCRPAAAALEGWRLWQAGEGLGYADVHPLYVREAVP
jgi:tRNA threonylcarbamoyladenosine biosynthesis protein TsaB